MMRHGLSCRSAGGGTRRSGPCRLCPAPGAAFTLVELLVVIAILGVLGGIVLPAMLESKGAAKRVHCLGNLRQMGIAAHAYVDDCGGFYPIAYYTGRMGGFQAAFSWDLTTVLGARSSVIPGLLWQGQGTRRIQQCPSFKGAANWLADPYTGYNYNTSFIGHGELEAIQRPAKGSDVGQASATVLFGDGQYGGGANKFMRAPWPNAGDATFRGRWAGTQGFRHHGRSSAAFCDGHVETLGERHTGNQDGAASIAPGTGFLSSDNSLYDLE